MKCICKTCCATVTDIACREHPDAGIELIDEPKTSPRAAKPSRKSRCPNPRDCGDPSCNGDCGY